MFLFKSSQPKWNFQKKKDRSYFVRLDKTNGAYCYTSYISVELSYPYTYRHSLIYSIRNQFFFHEVPYNPSFHSIPWKFHRHLEVKKALQSIQRIIIGPSSWPTHLGSRCRDQKERSLKAVPEAHIWNKIEQGSWNLVISANDFTTDALNSNVKLNVRSFCHASALPIHENCITACTVCFNYGLQQINSGERTQILTSFDVHSKGELAGLSYVNKADGSDKLNEV